MSDATPAYGPVTTRIFRIMVLAFGAGAVVFGVLAADPIVAQFSLTAAWWSIPTLVLTLGVPMAASACSWWAPIRVLRRLVGVTAVGVGLAMLLMQSALGGATVPDATRPWILELTAIGTTASAIAWRPRFVWPYVVVICALTVTDRIAAADVNVAVTAGEDGLYSLLFFSVFAGLALIAIRAGRTLDAAAAAAHAEVVETAAARARAQETARIDGLVHDTVLSTLLLAARGGDAQRADATRGAQWALAQLEMLRSADSSVQPLDGFDLVWRVQSTTTDLDPDAQFSYEAIPDIDVPGAVVQALIEATAEAVRNSLRHADGTDARGLAAHPVTRAVHVGVRADAAEITILDDGVGFDPTSVDPSRLGIEVSIRGRMASIAGGRATIVSRVGHGTRVLLEWRRQ